MEIKKSLDEVNIVAALLHDVQTSLGVFTPRELRLTERKLRNRYSREGIGFLTKTLPRLGKALDRALSGEVPFNCPGFDLIPGTKLPRFLGELFKRVFTLDGWVLPTPCVISVKHLRQLCFVFYKYELPYASEQEQEVLVQFQKTDESLERLNHTCSNVTVCDPPFSSCPRCTHPFGLDISEPMKKIVIRAQQLLSMLFRTFDERDIYPRHGPGSVSTKETLSGKYRWTRISPRITESYPLDEYFYVSLGHVCDQLQELQSLDRSESSAKVCLVPKDSRGPRLISEEPLEFQWIQQGLMRALVAHIERHSLTRHHVHFTDQRNNQLAALLGSQDFDYYQSSKTGKFTRYKLTKGKYATLDLKEASDRVSVGLVRLLFPEPLKTVLLNCRTLTTRLPDQKELVLNKFAPMGSALCFPVMALTIWALLTAGSPDADARDSILVFGDDVVVRTDQSAHATEILESFGLLVNRDKSYSHGFFRESCGVDAFRGLNVTPVKIHTVWASHRRPDIYTSFIAYANEFWCRGYYSTYGVIADSLHSIYGEIPSKDMHLACPSLVDVSEEKLPKRRRVNKDFQTLEYLVWDVKAVKKIKEIDGWSMLLRYFAEYIGRPSLLHLDQFLAEAGDPLGTLSRINREFPIQKFSVRTYTPRDESILSKCWR